MDFRKIIQKKMHDGILIYLTVGFYCVILAFVFDIYKGDILANIKIVINIFMKESPSWCIWIRELIYKLLKGVDNYCNLVMTLDTILAAAVIFFYSIKDSKRGGIPHRTILAYTFGSFTIPVLFIITLFMIPFYYIAYFLKFNLTVLVSLLFTYSIQIMIMVIIFLSTSYQYSVYAITNVEIRQFQILSDFKMKKQLELKKCKDTHKIKIEQNLQFPWVYLLHHLEQVTTSNELAIDKLLITRRILRVPYYREKIKLTEALQKPTITFPYICDGGGKKSSESHNYLNMLYEFYYENLLAVFKHIDQSKDLDYRNKVYLVLYEFLEELTKKYEGTGEIDKYKRSYAMVTSGVLNAVLSSGVVEADGFCNYVFNNIISEKIWNIQITLHFLFYEYLYRINDGNIRLEAIEGIKNIQKWKNNIADEPELYELFWSIWMECTTVSKNNSFSYYNEALREFRGDGCITGPIACIMQIYRKITQRGYTYDNKSSSND